MKKLLFTLTILGAFILGDQSASAQAKKKPAAPEDAAATAAEKAKSAATETAKTAAEKPKAAVEAAKPKRDTIPYYGEVASVDAKAKTITLKAKDPTKQRVFKVTAETKIVKIAGDAEASATLDEVKADAYITGSYKKIADGSLEVLKVTLGKTKAVKGEGGAKKPAEGAENKPADEPKKKK